jgi:glycosyltransferase involved in cell wall biosynthesis
MPPVVSVIMPTFNRLQFLAPAVDSLFAQTFTDWELIIADDGSDTATRSYLQTLHDPPRISVVWLTHSGRPAVARNAALREAHGEYVAFLDSDDIWLPRKLESQIASLRQHPARQWSYTRFALVDAAGEPKVETTNANSSAPSGWILEKLLQHETGIALPSVVVSRELLERLGPFDEELVMCEDDELWLRLAARSEIDGIEEPLTLVRRHDQHSGKDVVAWRDRRRVFEKALRACGDAHLMAILRRRRAEMSAGLAQSQAASRMRGSALRTLAASAHYSWRYRQWWRGALRVLVWTLAPLAMRNFVRRYRSSRRARPRAHA